MCLGIQWYINEQDEEGYTAENHSEMILTVNMKYSKSPPRPSNCLYAVKSLSFIQHSTMCDIIENAISASNPDLARGSE